MKPRVCIVETFSNERSMMTYQRHHSAWEFGTALMAEGAAVSLSHLGGPLENLWPHVSDADYVLLWDEDVMVDMTATRLALGGQRLLDVLSEYDAVTAPTMADYDRLAVFSGPETFARNRGDVGVRLIEELRSARTPLPIAGCGTHWLWIHGAALSRLAEAPAKPVMIGGIDITLSRQLLDGGASLVCDPRIATISQINADAGWSLPLEDQSSEASP